MNTNDNLESIFTQAIDLADPVGRGTFLDEACEGNARLRNRIGALLRANDRAAAFMSEPAGIVKLSDGPEEDFIGEQPGDVVGPYKLLQKIGEGGMGTVFLAEQAAPVRRKVALKIVKPGLDTKEVIARFESERQALALMNHPNIARVLDAGATQQGRPFFAMELVKGISITDYCNEGKLNPRQRLQLLLPVCQAIQHAHHKGIIHRDIKPRNVMITLIDGQAVPKVIDFGIAKAVDQRLTDKTLFTRYGEFIGTPAYMSPEQAAYSGIDVDTRSDVYSLGALTYELLAGVPPFDSERLRTMPHDELRKFICEETPVQPSDAVQTAGVAGATTIAQARSTTPRELRSLLHGELDWIVMRALEKERSRRYETASALADDIQRHLQNDAVVARPATVAYRLKKLVARHRVAVTAAAAIATILLVATCVSGWLAFSANHSRQRADLETQTLQEVVQFINSGLFSQAHPLEEPNRNVKLRTVIDRAAQRLDAQPIKRAGVEAAIRTTIGETYRGLGEDVLALSHLRRAHELCRSEYGSKDRKTIDAANRLVQVMLSTAGFEEAKRILDTTLRIATNTLQRDDPLLLAAMQLEAWRHEELGDYEKAERLLVDVLERCKDSLGASHPETYRAMANLAYVLQSQQLLDEALPLLQAAHRGILEAEGEWHPATLKSLAALASLHVRNEMDEAEAIYEATLPTVERLLGPDHHQTLTVKHGLALIHLARNHVREADDLFQQVFETQRKQLGDDHPSTLTTMHNLGMLRQSQGRYREAEALLQSELKFRRQSQGDDHRSTLDALSGLAFFYLDQAQFSKAIPYYEQAAAAIGQGGDRDPNSIVALTMLGLCHHKTGDHEQAKLNLELAKQQCEASMPNHWLQFVIDSLLGEVYFDLGRRGDAEDALLRGYDGLSLLNEEVPARWQPLGLRAATRRLVEFYESAENADLRDRATPYRIELAKLRQAIPLSPSRNGQTGNSKDGDPN